MHTMNIHIGNEYASTATILLLHTRSMLYMWKTTHQLTRKNKL